MPTKEGNKHRPVFTRNVLHGNAMNKRGMSSDYHHGGMRKERKVCYHRETKTMKSIAMEKSLLFDFTDGVVVGKWDKHSESPPRVSREASGEMKFTIPSSPDNRNVFENMVERTTELKSQALEEMRSKKMFEENSCHEFVLID